MRLVEFRVYVQVDDPNEETVWSMREFIRSCIENLDGVHAAEIEPLRGMLREPIDADILDTAESTS
jgi:hypothetical protein